MEKCKDLVSVYLTKFLDICTQIVLGYVQIEVCSNGGETYVIVKFNSNIANLMQIFEHLLLKNCSTEFFDIAYQQNNSQKQFEHR